MFLPKKFSRIKCLGLLAVFTGLIIIRDIIFELLFVIWILRNIYLWKKTTEYRSHDRGFTFKGFGKNQNERIKGFTRNGKEEWYNSQELTGILTEIKKFQQDTLREFTEELKNSSK